MTQELSANLGCPGPPSLHCCPQESQEQLAVSTVILLPCMQPRPLARVSLHPVSPGCARFPFYG